MAKPLRLVIASFVDDNFGDILIRISFQGLLDVAMRNHGLAPDDYEIVPMPLKRVDEELLAAVRDLRADLARVRSTEQTAALGTALAETEDEITRTGRAAPTRRERLRELLTDSQTLINVLASAGTLAGLLGR